MKKSLRTLAIVSLFHLLSAGLGMALAVREDLPAEFGGFLRGHNVLKDFSLGSGTALSPPLFILVAANLLLPLLMVFFGLRASRQTP
jgi:hypothetical protein